MAKIGELGVAFMIVSSRVLVLIRWWDVSSLVRLVRTGLER